MVSWYIDTFQLFPAISSYFYYHHLMSRKGSASTLRSPLLPLVASLESSGSWPWRGSHLSLPLEKGSQTSDAFSIWPSDFDGFSANQAVFARSGLEIARKRHSNSLTFPKFSDIALPKLDLPTQGTQSNHVESGFAKTNGEKKPNSS